MNKETNIMISDIKRRGLAPIVQKNVEQRQRPTMEIDSAYSNSHCRVWIPQLEQGAILSDKQFDYLWGYPRNGAQAQAAHNKLNDFIVSNFGTHAKLNSKYITWISECEEENQVV